MSFKERKNFFFKHRLCLGCSNPGHVIANCKKKLKCKECSKLHPTCLHIEEIEKDENRNDRYVECVNKCVNVCSILDQDEGMDNAMIIPV